MTRSTAEPSAESRAFALIGVGAGARLAGLGAGALLGVATTALAVRLLEPSLYGFLAFSISVMSTIAMFCRLGLEPGVAREATMGRGGEGLLPDATAHGALSLVALSTVAGGIVTAAIVLAGPAPVSLPTRLGFVAMLCLLLYASNTAAVAVAIARGLGRMMVMELPNLVLTLGKFVVIAALFAAGTASIGAIALGYAVAALVTAALSIFVVDRITSSKTPLVPSPGAALLAGRKYLPFAVAILGTITISRFDVMVLGLTASSRTVGIYEPTLKIVEQLMLLVPMVAVAPFLPAATSLFKRGDHVALKELFVSTSKLVYIASFPAVVMLAAFEESLFGALYGREFPLESVIPSVLLVGFVVNLAAGLNSSVLATIGDRGSLFKVGVGTSATMAILALVLVPWLGATGAALATSATYVFLNLLTGMAVFAKSGLHAFRADMVGTVLSSALPLGLALWLGNATKGGLVVAVGWSLLLWIVWCALLLGFRLVAISEVKRLLPGFNSHSRKEDLPG